MGCGGGGPHNSVAFVIKAFVHSGSAPAAKSRSILLSRQLHEKELMARTYEMNVWIYELDYQKKKIINRGIKL